MEKAKPKNSKKRESTDEERELFVTTDLRSVPASELKPMVGGLGKWVSQAVGNKLSKGKFEALYARESRRLVHVDQEHVSKRLQKHFSKLQSELEYLGFGTSFFASLPALGPIAAAMMAMSQRDGRIHFLAEQVAIRENGKISDDGFFSFVSYLPGGGSLITTNGKNLPRARSEVQREVVTEAVADQVLRHHRKRVRNLEIAAIAPPELFDHVASEVRLDCDDLVRRKVIRPATPAEITRIRQKSKV